MGAVGGEKLRDFLGIKQDSTMSRSASGGLNSLAGLTLNAVLSEQRLPPPASQEASPPVQSFRTLLDIIQEDQTFNSAKDNKRPWKGFKGKIRLRRGSSGPGSSWTSSMRMPTSEIPSNRQSSRNDRSISSRMFTRRASAGLPYSDQPTQPDIAAVPDVDRDQMSYPRSTSSPGLQRNASRVGERTNGDVEETTNSSAREGEEGESSPTEEVEAGGGGGEGGGGGVGEGAGENEEMENEEDEVEQQPVRMSLMALLAETGEEMGIGGSACSTDDEEDVEDEHAASAEYNSCCVCMVRHKGAAFIPCGHTFCRLCCRELLVQRGSCPLCNNYIVEVLDIF